jgi:hypothetical protein
VGETVEGFGDRKRCFGGLLVCPRAGGLTTPLPQLNRPCWPDSFQVVSATVCVGAVAAGSVCSLDQ